MWRVAALALLVCAGCAKDEDYLWHDTAVGEAWGRLTASRPYAPISSTSSPAFYPAAPAGAPAGGATGTAGGASGGQ
jgi:hypothetical protein